MTANDLGQLLFWCGSPLLVASLAVAFLANVRPRSVTLAASIGNAAIGVLGALPLIMWGFIDPWVLCAAVAVIALILSATIRHVRLRQATDRADREDDDQEPPGT